MYVGTTIRPLPCGCTLVGVRDEDPDCRLDLGIGTLQNPWTVKLCAFHAAQIPPTAPTEES